MNQQNPLDYQSPRRDDPYVIRARPRSHGKQFFIGLAAGAVISLIYWPSLWSTIDHGDGAALIWLLPAAKIIVALVFISFADTRAIGAGLLFSMVIGFIIFFGTCSANFKL